VSRFLRPAILALIALGLAVPAARAADPIPTVTTISVSTAADGATVTLTAQVASASGVPTGSVIFSDSTHPEVPLAPAVAVGPTGRATLTVPPSGQ
jgi:hypothetical protein